MKSNIKNPVSKTVSQASGAAHGLHALPVAPVILTKDEEEWLNAYRKMDLRRRGEELALAKIAAERHPMQKVVRPLMRIATSMGKRVSA